MINGRDAIINKVCALGCYSTAPSSNGQFLYASLSSNDAVDSSICSCKEENSNGSASTLWLSNANISLHTMNFTDNECYGSPVVMHPIYVSNEKTSNIRFSTIRDIFVRSYIVLMHGVDNARYKIEEINFINNSQNTRHWALILTDGPTTIKHSTILGNNKSVKWFYGRTS